nr:mitochondrial malate dehydrogenase [Crypthecodinium cohnii]USW07946.1 mitochondrial malate dehydrogenase [Crypthecodinium cohnii]
MAMNRGCKVCICGGAGGIGQPLALLMAMDSNVSELALLDLTVAAVPAEGVAADVSHLESCAKVTSFVMDPTSSEKPKDTLGACFEDSDLVLIPAGVPRKPGMNRSDLLNINLNVAKDLVEACARFCPNAIVALIVNPVNSIVPAMCEVYKCYGLDTSKILGVTSLDGVRANRFIHDYTGLPLGDIDVPVIGGHAGATILPLFSQDPVAASLPLETLVGLDKRVQDAGTEVVKAKGGRGSATLSMAFAAAKLSKAILNGLLGDESTPETSRTACTYLASTVTDLPFFASKVTFGPLGVEKIHPLGALTAYEEHRLVEAKKLLAGEIQDGITAILPMLPAVSALPVELKTLEKVMLPSSRL